MALPWKLLGSFLISDLLSFLKRKQVMLKRFIVIFAFFLSTLSAAATPVDSTFTPGKSYFGRNNYIEYIAGNTPYIISAPHGGTLTPSEIPDRTSGETVTDSNVDVLAVAISAAVFAREGRYPHIIICHLKRTKLDANRDLVDAAEPNPYATQAWKEFQSFIDTSAKQVIRDFGKGFYIDIHGHGHEIQRLELGYLLSSTTLALSNTTLDNPVYGNNSSIRMMIPTSRLTFSQLLRGPRSLGSLFENRSYPAVPSEKQPNPGSATYFSGGYNTERHGSVGGGPISGVQIECNMTGVRDTEDARRRFAAALAEVVSSYLSLNLFVTAVNDQAAIPLQPALLQNYPNPFNPATNFEFRTTSRELVTLQVFDVLGRKVATLVNEVRPAGVNRVRWDASSLPSGVYIYQLRAGSFVDTKKLMLVK
jgi:hypothetical protein